MNRRPRRRRSGFTIVEIVVVVIIIAALATMVLPRLIGRVGTAKASVARQKLTEIEKAVEMFTVDYGRAPATLDELVTRPDDIEEEKWTPPTLRAKDLLDPWGKPFEYLVPGEHGPYDLFSLGADGQAGGTHENADVVNWE